MDIEVIKKLIRKYQSGHTDFVRQAEKAKADYRNETDIMLSLIHILSGTGGAAAGTGSSGR